MKYSVKKLERVDPAFINEWQKLWEASPNASIFNSYEWFLMAIKSRKVDSYEIFVCYDEGQSLAALLPLAITKCFGVRVFSPLCYTGILKTAFLVKKHDEGLLRYFFAEIIKGKNIYIPKLDLAEVNLLHKIFPSFFFSLFSVNPYIDLREEPLRFLSNTFRYKRRKIEKLYGKKLTLRTYGEKDDLENLLETMFDIDKNSAKSTKSMDIFSKDETREFFKNIVKYCRKFVDMAFLYYDGKPVAYIFNLIYKNIYQDYQTSYLNDYRKMSPGIILLVKLLVDLPVKGYQIFDFSGGISDYKRNFTTQYYIQYNLYYSSNPLVMFWWHGINFARRLKQLLFPIKFTKDHEFLFKSL